MYKHLYKEFCQRNSHKLHFAAHSHHYWPDVTLQATMDYWNDSADLVDEKWSKVFGEKIPAAQKHIAKILNLPNPEMICFAPNTHELLYRLLSCFPAERKLKILTTDSEFYSFSRQIKRLEEDHLVECLYVPTQPFDTFAQRLKDASALHKFDLIFLSQVFFNSGVECKNIEELLLSLPKEPMMVLDGYHGFMAVPTDLKNLSHRVFYLGGSYKYAQGGEGCCFITIPENLKLKPRYTGWFAELDKLGSERTDETYYSQTGLSMAGSTMDYTSLYRLVSVLDLLEKNQLTVAKIHQYILDLQKYFIEKCQATPILGSLKVDQILINEIERHGHFLTFELASTQKTLEVVKELRSKDVLVDSRENRLRFGFGLYHDKTDIDELFKRVQR